MVFPHFFAKASTSTLKKTRKQNHFKWLFLIFWPGIYMHSEKCPENKHKKWREKITSNGFSFIFLVSHPLTQLCSGKALAIKSKSKDYYHKETERKIIQVKSLKKYLTINNGKLKLDILYMKGAE